MIEFEKERCRKKLPRWQNEGSNKIWLKQKEYGKEKRMFPKSGIKIKTKLDRKDKKKEILK